MKRTSSIILLLVLSLCHRLAAQNPSHHLESGQTSMIPAKISYQGILTDNAGTPVNGTVTMVCELFPGATDGNPVWSETHTDVTVTNGVFHILLGSNAPFNVSFDMPYFLSIAVDGTALLPRIELASSPYSLNTARIQGQAVSPAHPSPGEILRWTGSEWAPETVDALGERSGEMEERISFYKSEISVINEGGLPVSHAFLNLVSTTGGVGIRFYKDFHFGNEMETNPWHMGWIEGNPGYQGLAILRDWAFTAALWEADGKFIVGKLDSHPPANYPADATFEVRGTLDEVQAMVRGHAGQSSDVFRVVNGEGRNSFIVQGEGNVVVGSSEAPKGVILYDTADGKAYYLRVTNGNLELTRVE